MTAVEVWTPVCVVTDLLPNRGAAALLEDNEQVAIFRTSDDEVYALSNIDPFTGAAVLSRGIVGDLGGAPVVASPLHKQHFDLRTGVCVEDAAVAVTVYPVRVDGDTILVGRP
jgi:nitrite reductase (NADH) small subunit